MSDVTPDLDAWLRTAFPAERRAEATTATLHDYFATVVRTADLVGGS